MADTIQEQIVSYIETKLATITTGNGYATSVSNGQVKRYRVAGPEFQALPGITLAVVRELNSTNVYPVTQASMTMIIEAWDEFGDGATLDEKLGLFRADIQKALAADPTCGGLAHSTEVKRCENFVLEGTDQAVCVMEVEIVYSFLTANPYSQSVTHSAVSVSDGDLYDTISAIEEGIIQLLADEDLTDVNGIVFNNELRDGKLYAPYIRIFPEDTSIIHTTALREDIRYTFTVACIASSYSAADVNIARRIAMKASTVLKSEGYLNGSVSELRRTNWASNFTRDLPGGQVFGAAVTFQAHLLNSNN
jgi:hypothetical protein